VYVFLDLLGETCAHDFIQINLNTLECTANFKKLDATFIRPSPSYSAYPLITISPAFAFSTDGPTATTTTTDREETTTTMTELRSNDTLRLRLSKSASATSSEQLGVYMNERLLIQFELKDGCRVFPRFLFRVEDEAKLAHQHFSLNYGYFSVPVRTRLHHTAGGGSSSSRRAERAHLSTLIDMRLEARDLANPSLAAVATVADANEDTDQVLIHFDGWPTDYGDFLTFFFNLINFS
jgi:hypothetical protein